MQIDKELINKCIKYYANFKIDKKINLFGNFKYRLFNSTSQKDWLEIMANLYIIVFSMKNTKNYQEIISQEFENSLDDLIDREKIFYNMKKINTDSPNIDLWSEIVSEIEKILKE